jgi:transposase
VDASLPDGIAMCQVCGVSATEAIVEAAQRPTMRFVAAKTEEQQSRAIVFRTREQMVAALAIETFAPPMETFKCGRDFAAWLGLVPLQKSTGGKQRLGKTSKMGQRDIRRLLIIGAMAVLRWASWKGAPEGSWLARMMGKKPRMLVATALANKMARGIWAMLTKQEDYRNPAMVAA